MADVSKKMIEQGAFNEVHFRGLWLPGEQMPGELQHVVGIACFAGVRCEFRRKTFGRKEVFVLSVTADDKGAAIDDTVPESFNSGAELRFGSEFVLAGEANE